MLDKLPHSEFKEKRTGPDLLVSWVRVSSFIVWLMLIAMLVLNDYAKPQATTFFDKLFNISVNDSWDASILHYSFIVSIILFVFSLLSIFVNTKRLKRRSDRISFSLVLGIILSSINIILYLSGLLTT